MDENTTNEKHPVEKWIEEHPATLNLALGVVIGLAVGRRRWRVKPFHLETSTEDLKFLMDSQNLNRGLQWFAPKLGSIKLYHVQ